MQTFLVTGCSDADITWLESTLSEQGRIVPVGSKLEAIIGLIDQMQVGTVFVCVDRKGYDSAFSLIEGLSESRPNAVVVAIGDGTDSELVLGGMRAGAKDFLTVGQRGSEVQSLIRRLGRKQPVMNAAFSGQRARLVVLYGTDVVSDTTLIAGHVALELARTQSQVLLVDIAPGHGELEALLSLKCSFGLEDAMRAAQRLDSAVIESAFSRHESGLYVLPLLQDDRYPEAYTYADTILLLGVLRQHFACVIVNACGQPDGGFVRALVSTADQLLWYLYQSVPSSRRNLHCLQRWRSEGVALNNVGLLVDRYTARLAPEPSVLSEMFGIPLVATLAGQPHQRLNSLNQGVPLYKLAPKDELTRTLQQLAGDVLPRPAAEKRPGVLKRLFR
ncbi:pilus assembly protein [Halomonas aquamarina]|uniref:Pilus assembly protein n=1 Tax=Vreelandella aquamarina TaxID=77097 RepID=A0ACC5VTF1_9GAMM|nr:hypothetical protein [Halomonas aquamarina]MBZ5487041.1 pilus assembly protein [Halomonas aquamarina]